MIVVDAANVVGSRPDGWWKDRGKAAEKLCSGLADAIAVGRLEPPVTVVLEGAARRGVVEGEEDGLRVTHAPREGDDAIVDVAKEAIDDGQSVTVVTADRGLRARVQEVGADVVGPRWLLDRLEA